MNIEISNWAWLDKSSLTQDQLSWLKKTLTITQQVSKEYQNRSKPTIVDLWCDDESRNKLGIPREFFLEKMTKGHDISYSVSNGLEWPKRVEPTPDSDGKLPEWSKYRSDDDHELTFYDTEDNKPGLLRDEQLLAMEAIFNHFNNKPMAGALIQAGTGTGKTILGLAVARQFRLRTAVLVHRKFLMNQWVKRIKRFFPDMKVGTIVGKEWDVEDCHVVLVMIETISSWVEKNKVREELRDMFGLVICDEVHRGGAPAWGKSLPAFNSKYKLGVSAHPKRSDGLDKTIFYHIGPKIFTGTTVLRVPKIRRVWSNYKVNHPRLNASMLSMEFAFKFLSKDPIYNQDVIDQIKLALEANRKILVYSHTVNHLKLLKTDLDSQWSGRKVKTDFFIGGMTEDELDESAESDVIFATFQMAKDSLDIPSLDTVVLAAPIRNPQQPAGRACREFPNKKDPVVVDMRVDNVPVFRNYAESRDKAYARLYGDSFLNKQTNTAVVSK